MRILIVEDNPLVAKLVPAVLERAFGAVEATSVGDLESAYSTVAHQGAPDLAVLDLGLPRHAGVDTLRRFRLKFPAVPVVVFSATDDAASVRVARELGAIGYLPKRLNAEQMVRALRQIVEEGSYYPAPGSNADGKR